MIIEGGTDRLSINYGDRTSTQHCLTREERKLQLHLGGSLQVATHKFLDNCYKTQLTSYMDIIYFYSSKYIPP
jgi:hypothetical protein